MAIILIYIDTNNKSNNDGAVNIDGAWGWNQEKIIYLCHIIAISNT